MPGLEHVVPFRGVRTRFLPPLPCAFASLCPCICFGSYADVIALLCPSLNFGALTQAGCSVQGALAKIDFVVERSFPPTMDLVSRLSLHVMNNLRGTDDSCVSHI